MTPAEYRAKWGLPADYPMVAPNYAAKRAELARALGLPQPRRKAASKAKGNHPAESMQKALEPVE
jgi:predicted transcriptional regulator